MIKGTQWTKVVVWYDDEVSAEYDVKVAYEYDYITNHDPFYQQIHSHIEVIQWPQGVSERTKSLINYKLNDVLSEILQGDDVDEYEPSYEND